MTTTHSITFRLSRCLWCVVLIQMTLHLSRQEISLISFLCIASVLYSPVIYTNCDFAKRKDTNQNCPSFTSYVKIHIVITAIPVYRQDRQFKSALFPLYITYVSNFLTKEVKLLSYWIAKLAKFLKLSTNCRNTKFNFLHLYFW